MLVATVGSLANQKYEVNKNIQRHLKIIHNSVPSQETTQWKNEEPLKAVGSNNEARKKLSMEEITARNTALSNRLFGIMNEQREARSFEYAPGWRTGIGNFFPPL